MEVNGWRQKHGVDVNFASKLDFSTEFEVLLAYPALRPPPPPPSLIGKLYIQVSQTCADTLRGTIDWLTTIMKQDAQIGHWVGRAYWEGQQLQCTTEASKKAHYWIVYFPFIPKHCKLPAHMRDKVSAVDRFSFWFSSRYSFQGAKSIVMQTSIVSDQISGGRSLWESPLQTKVIINNRILSKMRISHHYNSFSARIIEPR